MEKKKRTPSGVLCCDDFGSADLPTVMPPALVAIGEMKTNNGRTMHHIRRRIHDRGLINDHGRGPHDDGNRGGLHNDRLGSGLNNHLLNRLLHNHLLNRAYGHHDGGGGDNRCGIHRGAMMMGVKDPGQYRTSHHAGQHFSGSSPLRVTRLQGGGGCRQRYRRCR